MRIASRYQWFVVIFNTWSGMFLSSVACAEVTVSEFGTTADGTLYRSDVGTFRFEGATPPTAPTSAAPGDNAAPEATVVGVSSEFAPGFGAANAIDGDLATEWSTTGDGDDGSISSADIEALIDELLV